MSTAAAAAATSSSTRSCGTGSIVVCQATLDHLDDLVPLFDGYRQFYKQPSDLVGAKTFLTNRIANSESIIFIAYDKTTQTNNTQSMADNASPSIAADAAANAVGFTQLYPSFSSVSMQRLWILNDLFVAESARSRGVASSLMERAEEFAFSTGAKGLMLETAISNRAAQALYERRNWKRDTHGYIYTFACAPG